MAHNRTSFTSNTKWTDKQKERRRLWRRPQRLGAFAAWARRNPEERRRVELRHELERA